MAVAWSDPESERLVEQWQSIFRDLSRARGWANRDPEKSAKWLASAKLLMEEAEQSLPTGPTTVYEELRQRARLELQVVEATQRK